MSDAMGFGPSLLHPLGLAQAVQVVSGFGSAVGGREQSSLSTLVSKSILQRAFEIGVVGLAGQQWQRAVENGSCAYRKREPDGRVSKCFIGHIIADEDYSPCTEGLVPGSLIKAFSVTPNMAKSTAPARLSLAIMRRLDIRPSEYEALLPLLVELQGIHDNAFALTDIRDRFLYFAGKHGLAWPSRI